MPTIEQASAWYPHADPVHGFDHVLRVYAMAERLAQVEKADLEIVRAAALLHDAIPPVETDRPTHENNAHRANHHTTSADFAGQVLAVEGWSAERIAAVQHAIRAHRFRDLSEQPQTIEAKVLFDSDKLDAIGAIGAARAIAYAIQAGQPAYAPPSSQFLETGQLEPGEPHSAFHEHVFKLSQIKRRLYTASGRQVAAERHNFLEAFFEQLASEMRGEI
jgi:uncharacterized protein